MENTTLNLYLGESKVDVLHRQSNKHDFAFCPGDMLVDSTFADDIKLDLIYDLNNSGDNTDKDAVVFNILYQEHKIGFCISQTRFTKPIFVHTIILYRTAKEAQRKSHNDIKEVYWEYGFVWGLPEPLEDPPWIDPYDCRGSFERAPAYYATFPTLQTLMDYQCSQFVICKQLLYPKNKLPYV